jgi:hypothetical protein
VSEWGDISICRPGISLILDQQIDMLPHSDTHYPDSEPTDRYVTPLGHIIQIPNQQRNQDNVCPSGATYLSVDPESG